MFDLPEEIETPVRKIEAGERISDAEALALVDAPLSLLGLLATRAKERKSGRYVYYNRNFHIEPTNVCVFNCRFCSYRRPADSPEAWDYGEEEILAQVEAHRHSGATEIHIVGGVHPRNDLHYYVGLIRKIKAIMPEASVKAFTAIELAYMIRKAGLAPAEGLCLLRDAGMEAIPGGGAEIFAESVRQRICPEKGTAEEWLAMHREAHRAGIPTNATILYGHIESWEDRIDHLSRLRSLQDETGGFNAFIPLKYRSRNNAMSEAGEVSVVEDMRMTALSRLYLDNVPHIKAYWPMFGKTTAQMALAFGADDMDGTIDDSTKIYSMAGAEDRSPSMTTEEMERTIRSAGYLPVERDTFYNPVKK
ncbi:CofH family radical SAM protein [uncultured Alistipes sp.]|uniref:radical SAM protein n=1 Tax=uncultured Alistipes sp. TaxID=538949 RepID=UPI00262822A4|nr:CofH family radical SAM protein [uncultured Alistipes sp.]